MYKITITAEGPSIEAILEHVRQVSSVMDKDKLEGHSLIAMGDKDSCASSFKAEPLTEEEMAPLTKEEIEEGLKVLSDLGDDADPFLKDLIEGFLETFDKENAEEESNKECKTDIDAEIDAALDNLKKTLEKR